MLCPSTDIVIDMTSADVGKRSFYVLDTKKTELTIFHEDVRSDFIDVVNATLTSKARKICFDFRKFMAFTTNAYCDVYDVSILKKSANLYSLINRHLGDDEVSEYERHNRKIVAAQKAMATVGGEMGHVRDITQPHFVDNFHKMRCISLMLLFKKVEETEIDEYESYTYQLMRTYYDMERNRVNVDCDALAGLIASSLGDRRFVSGVRDNIDDGYVTTSFNVSGARTGRVLTDKGRLNLMTIPKSDVRRLFSSRFDGGKIVSFDFNALDYRCVIASVGGDVKSEYDGCSDFHTRTVELLFGRGSSNDVRRRVIKEMTYVIMYGGSKRRLHEMGLSQKKVDVIFDRLSSLMSPIFDFSRELAGRAASDGHVDVFNFKRLHFSKEETTNPNYVLALYAQTCSAKVFSDAVIAAHKNFTSSESRDIFTVHDEYVVDMHPMERYLIDRTRSAMSDASWKTFDCQFVVTAKVGDNYGELTDG